ncbi:MAG: hypothetical protein QOH03_2241 [Kribbellaceae bacterium]|jgi:hypothetical protein|nr:hypothetical protein [Kribbellaceae bacterium]
MRDIALILHVGAGLIGVVFGPLAVVVTLRARRLTWAGEIFHWAVALICLTALVMVPYDWGRLWVFWPLSIAAYLFVYLGQRAAESPDGLWYRGVLRGYGGGWIALWTAILVVNAADQPWIWPIPIILGAATIELLCHHPATTWTQA